MRFVPHSNPHWQTSSDKFLLANTNVSDSDIDNSAYNSDSETLTSTEDIHQLPEFLSLNGLNERFNLACALAESHFGDVRLSNDENDTLSSPTTTTLLPSVSNSMLSNHTMNHDNLTQYFVSKFSNERLKRKTAVDELIRLEEERIRKIEEERRRKEEEERLRKEEEERKRREEVECKAKEEAKRKRIEEEKRLKAIEDEKKRIEEEKRNEQELKEKLQKEKELEIARKEKELNEKKELERKQTQEKDRNMIIKPSKIEESYLKYIKDVKDIETQILKPVQDNKDLKKLVGSQKRKINPKFGQLTNSQAQLTRITNEIVDLISQAQANELAFKWLLNFVSDAIISQAETEVSVKPKSSLPLAKLTLNLLIIFKDLPYFLLAKFYKSCPFLLGYSCSQDTEEGRIRLGWSRDESTGKWENETQHNERLSGIATLYFVITRLKLNHTFNRYDPSNTIHPLPISNSWIFLSRIVDTPIEELSETHYTIVGAWWDACANEFLQAYCKQSIKLLRLISHEWTKIGGKSSAAKVRLSLLGEEWSRGTIVSFPEMEA